MNYIFVEGNHWYVTPDGAMKPIIDVPLPDADELSVTVGDEK